MRAIVHGKKSCSVHLNDLFQDLSYSISLCLTYFSVTETELASYADDNTPFLSGDRLDDVLDSLENASFKLSDWFSDK